jgi:hypothetical protein
MTTKHRLTGSTKYKIRRLVRIIKEQPDIKMDELCNKFRLGLSSISRLKRLAVDHGYASHEDIFGRPKDEPVSDTLSVKPPAAGTVEVKTDSPGLLMGSPVVVSLVLGKLAEVMRGNEPAINLWQHIRTIVDLEIFNLTQGRKK